MDREFSYGRARGGDGASRQIAGPGREIEDDLAAADLGDLEDSFLPPPVQPRGHHVVRKVVPVRDAREEPPDIDALVCGIVDLGADPLVQAQMSAFRVATAGFAGTNASRTPTPGERDGGWPRSASRRG